MPERVITPLETLVERFCETKTLGQVLAAAHAAWLKSEQERVQGPVQPPLAPPGLENE